MKSLSALLLVAIGASAQQQSSKVTVDGLEAEKAFVERIKRDINFSRPIFIKNIDGDVRIVVDDPRPITDLQWVTMMQNICFVLFEKNAYMAFKTFSITDVAGRGVKFEDAPSCEVAIVNPTKSGSVIRAKTKTLVDNQVR